MSCEFELTIAVPTYKRVQDSKRNLESLIESGVADRKDIEVLFIDNASPDGTFETLSRVAGGRPNVRVLSNPTNIGFGGNFLRLIRESRGAYVLVTSDEDLIDGRSLDDLLKILRPRTYAVVTSHYSTGETDPSPRGTPLHTAIVEPSRFETVANYISGVSFLASASKNALPILEPHTAGPAGIYIQNLLVAVLMLDGEVLSWKTRVCFPHAFRETTIPKYDGLQHRWDQTKELLSFLDDLATKFPASKDRVTALRKGVRDGLAHRLRHAVNIDGAEYARVYDRSVIDYGIGHTSTRELAAILMRRIIDKLTRRGDSRPPAPSRTRRRTSA